MSEVIVLQSFVGNVDGGDLHFHAGDLYASDHKAAKKWPHLFGPFQPAVIESASAAPGEKRGIRLRRAPKATAAQEAGMAHQLKVEAEDAAMPEPKPIPEPAPVPEPEKAPAGKAMTVTSFEGK